MQPTPTQPEPKLTTFVVELAQRDGSKIERIVNARRATDARDHLIADGTIAIRKASTHDAMALVAKGVKVETAAHDGNASTPVD